MPDGLFTAPDPLLPRNLAKLSFIVSHRLPLGQAAEAYRRFDMRGVGEGAGYTKVLLKPDLDRKARAA